MAGGRDRVEPRWWTDDELRTARDVAEQLFRARRKAEGPDRFAAFYWDAEPLVRNLLDVTSDLRDVSEGPLAADSSLWQVLRFAAGPPISEEDMWTMVGASKSKQMKPQYAADCAEIVSLVLDTVRFPWLAEDRAPTLEEREAAILASTCLIANERQRTARRMTASSDQEAATAAVLESAGFGRVDTKVPVSFVDDMDRGTYSKERRVAGAKCDVPVRLFDGRLLLIECKVSNGPKNGWKRLLRETAGKRGKWRETFGDAAVTAAVVAGVFDASCLREAQRDRVVLYWDHDLVPLRDFLDAAR